MNERMYNAVLGQKEETIMVLKQRLEGKDNLIASKEKLISTLQMRVNQMQEFVTDLRECLKRSHAIILAQRQQATADNNFGYPQGIFWQNGEA